MCRKSSKTSARMEMPPFDVRSAGLSELAAVSRHGLRLGVLGTPQHFEADSIRKTSDRNISVGDELASAGSGIAIAA
jgi:hypothetical protein